MSDEPTHETRGAASAAFDDDRLLAYALGLDLDPTLETALPASAELRARLEAIAADVRVLDAGLQAVTPPVAEDWSDPGAERWRDLRPYFTAAGPAKVRRVGGRTRLLQWAGGLAAAAALLVGAVVLAQMGGGVGGDASRPMSAPLAAEKSAADQVSSSDVDAALDAARYFKVAVVARGGAVQGDTQLFEVVRRLKGRIGETFSLKLAAIEAAAEPGALTVVLLRPRGDLRGPGGTELLGTPGSTGAATSDGVGASPSFGTAAGGGFSYAGAPVYVQALPHGADPQELRLR